MENGESEFRFKQGAMPYFAMTPEEQAIFNQTARLFFNAWRYFRGAIYNVSEERLHQIYIKYWNESECEVYKSRAVEPRLGNGTVSAPMVTHPAENVPDWPKTAANTNNLYVGQLDAILRFWGSENGHDPQLDCVQSDTRTFLVPVASRPDITVIWISLTSSTACEGEQIRHHEGIRGLEKPRNSKDHAELISPFEDPQYEITDNRDDEPHTRDILSTPFYTMTQEEKDARRWRIPCAFWRMKRTD
ncbi:hypothetical protein BGZ57DRAFT_948949 [Hyaloscypha finlandica]|nr:hypothetical protein BGZ57DRAFT_948949 [Hyaloscypha finlandica]